jgi:hypothetical protein
MKRVSTLMICEQIGKQKRRAVDSTEIGAAPVIMNRTRPPNNA